MNKPHKIYISIFEFKHHISQSKFSSILSMILYLQMFGLMLEVQNSIIKIIKGD